VIQLKVGENVTEEAVYAKVKSLADTYGYPMDLTVWDQGWWIDVDKEAS
jgi:hypothetical protein